MQTNPNVHITDQIQPSRPALRVVPPEYAPTGSQIGICKRLNVVLYDLGLVDIVGGGWIQPAENGFAVGALSLRSADHLVRRLETLAIDSGHRNLYGSPSYVLDDAAVAAIATADGYEQLRFF